MVRDVSVSQDHRQSCLCISRSHLLYLKISIFLSIYMYVYIYMCVCIHIHTHTHTHTCCISRSHLPPHHYHTPPYLCSRLNCSRRDLKIPPAVSQDHTYCISRLKICSRMNCCRLPLLPLIDDTNSQRLVHGYRQEKNIKYIFRTRRLLGGWYLYEIARWRHAGSLLRVADMDSKID